MVELAIGAFVVVILLVVGLYIFEWVADAISRNE